MAFGGSFGNPTTSAPAFGTTSTFGFGNTSAPATTSGFTFGGFGTTTTTPSTGFSFGAPTTTSSPFSFSSLPTTTTSSFGFGGFGTSLATTTSGFSFGQTTSAFGGGGLFSTGMGMQQPTASMTGGMQPQNPAVDNAVTSLVTSLTFPMLYGDERDAIIAKWNQLQASWGIGKGYYHPNAPPVELTPENPFCCFKAVGYSCLPSAKSEDCLVGIVFNKKDQEIISQQQQLIDTLHKCFGSKPTISVTIDGIKALTEDRTEVVFYLLERLQTGLTRRIPPAEICGYLEQPTVKPQIANLGIVNVVPKIAPSKEQLQSYLDNPPAGLEPIVWKQAKLDNPDPEKLIPVPLIGFQELSRRTKCQEYETKQHQKRLEIISDDIAELNRNHTTTVAKIAEHKRKLLELQHRVLKVLVHQEITRKMGYAIQADEEQLRIKFEAIQAELSAPTQFKGHLKELTSQIRMQNYQTSVFEGERYSMDEIAKEEIREQLLAQQEGISLLINIIKEDMADLKTIEEIINDETIRRR
ncbi:nucleoporin p54-like [Argiope bruennichi]|uniref:Nuclear pore complex protein Nup54 like protein n=1 Tax=Argiope bruennichi TaxID=94029 RepID=A0A8T0EZT0_ARGBR|nr:nucleoporin p54-like [Argiope bruennichi]XP_055934600.1 nucleoporin p54-like [Argiope bruennichi]KAF8783087.1 Nuclear pore complex protein Nup54 like protein [Argiope bruennichi]